MRKSLNEVGNHDMRPDLDENERFLSLFGVIVEGRHMIDVIQPEMRKIKQEYFQKDPDEHVIFHRKDITVFAGHSDHFTVTKKRDSSLATQCSTSSVHGSMSLC